MEQVIQKAMKTPEQFQNFIKNISDKANFCQQFYQVSLENNYKYHEAQLKYILKIQISTELLLIQQQFILQYFYKLPDFILNTIFQSIIQLVLNNQDTDLTPYIQLFQFFDEAIIGFKKQLRKQIQPLFLNIQRLSMEENQFLDNFYLFLFQLEQLFQGFELILLENMMHSLVLLDIQTEIYADQRKFEFTEHRLTESDISASLKGMSILQQPSNVTTSEPSNNIPIQPKLVNSLQQIDSLLFVLITYLSNKDEVFLQTQFMSLFITIVLPIQNLKYAPFLIFPLLQNENLQNSIFGQLFQLAFANPQTPINIVVITVDYISSLLCYSQSIQPIFTEQILTALLQISNELLLVNNSRLEQKFDLNTPGAQRAILSVRAFVRIVSFAWKTISIQQFESGVKALLLSQIFSFIGGFVEDFSRILINIGAFEADVIQCVAEQAQHRYSIDIFEQGLLGRIQLQKSSAFIEDLYRDDMDLGDE